ncbi:MULTISPECIES: CD1375 family protein [Oscillospiraceae]
MSDWNRKVNETVNRYVQLIRKGRKTVEQVPASLREQVRKLPDTGALG